MTIGMKANAVPCRVARRTRVTVRRVAAALLAAVCMTSSMTVPPAAAGNEPPAGLRTNEYAHLTRALDAMNMSTADLGFDKDVAEPTNALHWVRELLHAPLRAPAVAADTLFAVTNTPDAADFWPLAARWLECGDAPLVYSPPSARTNMLTSTESPPLLRAALNGFLAHAAEADTLIKRAFAGLSSDDRQYLAANRLTDISGIGDHPERMALIEAEGVPTQLVTAVLNQNTALDPEPDALRFLSLMDRIDWPALLAAGRTMDAAALELGRRAASLKTWWGAVVNLQTPLGNVVIGSPGNDRYSEPALLILDPGGNDTYAGQTGLANGLRQQPLAAIVDLSGDDSYRGHALLAAGSALFGAAAVVDRRGADRADADFAGQAAAIFGAATWRDEAGDDDYTAGVFAQGAAYGGAALMHDADGCDRYRIGLCGQAYAGVRGVGLLVDAAGHDTYFAGNREPDYERHAEHFVTLAQGFATGMRPFAGGGVAALVDLAGNDLYTADVYGQGVSYWYAVGLLIDGGGHDRYSLHEYGQGAGIHLSVGMLFELGGNDFYQGFSLAQGAAHDYAVGMLFDRAGDDTYTADHYSQGRGLNNAFGLLVDDSGRDAYFGRYPNSCQGIGDDGRRREYGCISLLLDLRGPDTYSCGATNGTLLERPNYGVVYDVDE